mgnify:FL=1
MALFPLSMKFSGDFVCKLLPIDTENTMAEVAEAASVHAVGMHVAEQPGKTIRIKRQGDEAPFDLNMKVKDSGLLPTETIELYFE